VILSLDSDLLTSGPGCVRYAREFSRKRRVNTTESKMNRLYAVESTPTNTGADGRSSLEDARIGKSKASPGALAKELDVAVAAGPPISSAVNPEWIPALVARPQAECGRVSGRRRRSSASDRARAGTFDQSGPRKISTRQFISRSRLKNRRSINGNRLGNLPPTFAPAKLRRY